MSWLAAHSLYALAWLSFGAGHSLLASAAVKRRQRPVLGLFYRLAYNLFATLHIALVLALGRYLLSGGGGWALAPAVEFALDALFVAGVAAFLAALPGYDLGRLAGTRQIRNHFAGISEPEDEPLRRDGLHRFVRHPLYAASFPILWGRVDDDLTLATALWGSTYLLIGAWLEERRLLALYGAAYAAYRARVPAFVPWKGRAV